MSGFKFESMWEKALVAGSIVLMLAWVGFLCIAGMWLLSSMAGAQVLAPAQLQIVEAQAARPSADVDGEWLVACPDGVGRCVDMLMGPTGAQTCGVVGYSRTYGWWAVNEAGAPLASSVYRTAPVASLDLGAKRGFYAACDQLGTPRGVWRTLVQVLP